MILLILAQQPLFGDEHEHEHEHEESRNNVGPTKGVLEADEHEGFVLNEKAEKNFAIQKLKLSGSGPIVVPSSALLYSGLEKQVYRYRKGRWKAVDIEIVSRDRQRSTLKSKDLTAGDSVAVSGVGFLKIVEQSIFGPQAEGHVH
jgi:hypothetical protein